MKFNTPAFWETETPEVIRTEKNTLRYYPKAGFIAVHGQDYYDRYTGELKSGRYGPLNLRALAENKAAAKALVKIILKYRPDAAEADKEEDDDV